MIAATEVNVPLWPWGVLIIGLGIYAVAVAAFLAAGRREDARALAGFIPDSWSWSGASRAIRGSPGRDA